jgi:hypothetical protein
MQQANTSVPATGLLQDIHAAIARGNLQLADFLCREQLERGAAGPELWRSLATIATQVGAHAVAVESLQAARQLDPGEASVLKALQSARTAQQQAEARVTALTSPRYLLIKA